MEDYEKLGQFYLGRPYDLESKQAKPGLLLYDSKDLVTHAVCVGMTGSGKTGLCIGLLEEAAIDGIPAIIIDPKGDLSNLLLTFPKLTGESFLPWINEEEGRKKGLSPSEYADEQAALWKKGLKAWGQDGKRIKRLKDSAEFSVYTPGSTAGIPVSILKSFAVPPQEILEDTELLGERIETTVTSLLGLLGVDADPIQSREHILLSTIFGHAWKEGEDLDLAPLIQHIQTPPVAKVGVMDVESFYPSKDRFALAMRLNNLLAAPGFAAWMDGEALDIDRFLHSPTGTPRVSIFSIAHLNDKERMFFVTLLLSQMLGWMRGQSGTSSLRALLYMDEIFGYFPPVSNPPSKRPLLTMLKQARAFGVGVVLATQNPVDLDYKGLANTGTWFIGRLQTERDKARVLEGLEGASASTGKKFDKQAMESLLAGLGSRVFLMNNVHEDAPEVFETRWVLSYLRGPLTRTQIKQLQNFAPVDAEPKTNVSKAASRPVASKKRGTVSKVPKKRRLGQQPVLPPDVPQYFISPRGAQTDGMSLVYHPWLFCSAHVHIVDRKKDIDQSDELHLLAPISGGALPVDWDAVEMVDFEETDLETQAEEGAGFSDLPATAGKAKSYNKWNKEWKNWVYRNHAVELLKSPSLGELSRPSESERDFRIRLQQLAHEERDVMVEKIRKKYAPKIVTLQDRIRRAELAVEREAEQAKQSKLQTVISVGATLVGAFLGRKAVSRSSVGRATTAIRGAGRAVKEATDVGRAQENVKALEQRLLDLEAEFEAETEKLAGGNDPLTETFESVTVRPKKMNISIQLAVLTWMPYWQDERGARTPAWE